MHCFTVQHAKPCICTTQTCYPFLISAKVAPFGTWGAKSFSLLIYAQNYLHAALWHGECVLEQSYIMHDGMACYCTITYICIKVKSSPQVMNVLAMCIFSGYFTITISAKLNQDILNSNTMASYTFANI